MSMNGHGQHPSPYLGASHPHHPHHQSRPSHPHHQSHPSHHHGQHLQSHIPHYTQSQYNGMTSMNSMNPNPMSSISSMPTIQTRRDIQFNLSSMPPIDLHLNHYSRDIDTMDIHSFPLPEPATVGTVSTLNTGCTVPTQSQTHRPHPSHHCMTPMLSQSVTQNVHEVHSYDHRPHSVSSTSNTTVTSMGTAIPSNTMNAVNTVNAVNKVNGGHPVRTQLSQHTVNGLQGCQGTNYCVPPKTPSPPLEQQLTVDTPSEVAVNAVTRKRARSELMRQKSQNADSTPNTPVTPATAPPPSKRRKTNGNGNVDGNGNGNGSNAVNCRTPRAATNRVWRQTRQTAKLRMAMEHLDNFKSEHGGKLPSLRAIMKMLKVGFPKAHEILNRYAKHVGCSKEQLVQDMTIRQEKRNRDEEEEGKQKRLNRNMLEYPINVNGKLQEMMLNLLHQQKVQNTSGFKAVLAKLERSMAEFEIFYAKFEMADKVRMGQSYYILAKCHFDRYTNSNSSKGKGGDHEGDDWQWASKETAYRYIGSALSTFRDCNRLAAKLGLSVEADGVGIGSASSSGIRYDDGDVGYFWFVIVEVYILGGHILLHNKQYEEAQTLYEFAYGLVLDVNESTTMDTMVTLEQLAMVSMHRDTNRSKFYFERILECISSRSGNEVESISIEVEEEEVVEDQVDITAINVKACYSCICSLDAFERGDGESGMYSMANSNSNSNQMKEAMDLEAECLKALREKFGAHHPFTFALTLYFGLHWVEIEQFDRAFDHIEYLMAHSVSATVNGEERVQSQSIDKRRRLQFLERKRVHDLLQQFAIKLLTVGTRQCIGKESWMMELFEYQMQSVLDLNALIPSERKRRDTVRRERLAEREREREMASPRRRIKKEKESEDKEEEEGAASSETATTSTATTVTAKQQEIKEKEENENKGDDEEEEDDDDDDDDLRPIDAVEMALRLQIPLMLQYGEFEGAMKKMADFETDSQRSLTDSQRASLSVLRAQCAAKMSESANWNQNQNGNCKRVEDGDADLDRMHNIANGVDSWSSSLL